MSLGRPDAALPMAARKPPLHARPPQPAEAAWTRTHGGGRLAREPSSPAQTSDSKIREPEQPAPESAEAPAPSLIAQARTLLQAEALKPDGKFSLLDETKVVELVDAQVTAQFAQRPNIDKNSDEYKLALKTAKDALTTQNAANKAALEFINPGPEQTGLLAQVNDQGERVVDHEFKNEVTGEVITQKRPINEVTRIQNLLTRLGGEGTALALQLDQTRQMRVKVGDTIHTLTRGQYVEMKMTEAEGKTPDEQKAMRDEANKAFDAKAVVVEKTESGKAGEAKGTVPEQTVDPMANVVTILNDEMRMLMEWMKKDRKKYAPYLTLISDALAENGPLGNDAKLLALERVRELQSKMKPPEKITPAQWESRLHDIEAAAGYLKGEGAGKADVMERLIKYHYGQKGQEIPQQLQELMKKKITYTEFRQAWVEYRLDRNNKQVRDILSGKTKLKDPKNAKSFIDYILQNNLLSEMQKHTRALAHQPVDYESVKQYSTQILTQMGAEPNDRSLEYMRMLLLGDDDKGMAVVGGVTIAGILAGFLQNTAGAGVTPTWQEQQSPYG